MGMGVTGLLQSVSGYSDSDLYGRRPVVPGAVDYGSAVGRAIESNITNLPSLKELAGLSTDALNDLMERAMPGYKTLRDAGTNTLTSWARGELTPEMDADVQRRAAEMGITLGTADSKFTGHRGLKLGLDTRIGLQERGLQSGAQWIQQAQNRTFDFSKMFLGPQDAIRETEFNWQRDWLANQVAAAPDPGARGAFDSEMAFIGMVLSVYGGGAGYTGQSRPTYGSAGAGGGGSGGGNSFFGSGGYGASEGGGNIGNSFSPYGGARGGVDYNEDSGGILGGLV